MGSELNKALVAAQAEMKNPSLNATNPHFRNRYADLAEVRSVVIPVLTKHGLALTQSPTQCDGMVGVHNRLFHVSGEEADFGACLLPLSKQDPQGAGSAITYARRYSLQAIAGVVGDEDDDANQATGHSPKAPTTTAAAKATATATTTPSSQPGSSSPTGLKFGRQIETAQTMADLIEVAKFLEKEPQAVKDAHRQMFREAQAKLEKK
jgi:hypothetical protein